VSIFAVEGTDRYRNQTWLRPWLRLLRRPPGQGQPRAHPAASRHRR
jgi:hypothetical protein